MVPVLLDGPTRVGWLKDCLSCEVTEERNGIYELTLTYPASESMAKEMTVERFIKAKPNQTAENQLFKIYKVSKPINGTFTVNAEHVSYALSHYPISYVSLSSANPTQAIDALLTDAANNLGSSHGFMVETSDIATNAAFSVSNVSARAGMGGVEGSVLDTYGGEFEFDNYKIKLHRARGSNNGVIISYGKNLTDVKCDISSDSSYTAVYAYAARDDVSVSLTKPVTNNSGIAARVLMRDFSGEFGTDEEMTNTALSEKVTEWLASNDINALTVSMSVSFVDLSQSPEYASYKLLESVNLCDTVTVRHKDLNLDVTAKVVKTTYDVLGEKYSKIELGSARANFSSTIQQLQKDTQNVKYEVKKTESKITQEYLAAIQNATNAITGNSGGYVRLNPAENPQELLIMDTPDAETAVNIWRFNLAGFGHSSKGYDGPYTTAITQDGHIVADFIDAGTLKANIIKAGILEDLGENFYVNFESGESQFSNVNILGGNIDMDGGTFRTSSKKGGVDLSPGYLSLSYGTTGDFTYWNSAEVATGLDLLMTGVGIKNTATGKFLPKQGWYATFATSIPDTSSEETNRRGFRFATNSENIVYERALSISDFWKNTLAVLENDALRVRKQIIVNEYGYATGTDPSGTARYMGLAIPGTLGGMTRRASFGVSMVPGTSSPGATILLEQLSDGEYSVNAELGILSAAVGTSATIRMRSGTTDLPALTFNASALYYNGKAVTTSSTERIKKDIEAVNFSASDKIRDSQIYSYRLKDEHTYDGQPDSIARYGLVVERECPEEVIDVGGDSINLYSMCSLGWKAIQEIISRLDRLEATI